MSGLLVVGTGLAGLRAAETARRQGFDGRITLVGDEPHRPYNRPPLSKAVLSGTAEPASTAFDTEALEATWLLGRSATRLDPRRKVVTLDERDELEYDKLVIATGVRPRPWRKPLSLRGIHTLRTLDDAVVLRDAAARSRRVAVIGAGFLGSEMAAALRQRGKAVSLLDVADYPLAVLGPQIGSRALELHRRRGVDLHLGVEVARFEGSGDVEGVRLESGELIEADLVVIAIGALPNTEWLVGSGLELWNGGVRCDEYCLAVGVSDVAAAGDVAAWPRPITGAPIRVEHWTNAAEMGMAAASNLFADAIARVPHAPVLTFWTDQYDVAMRAAGTVADADSCSLVDEDSSGDRSVFELRRGRELVGAVTFNSKADHLRYRRRLAAARKIPDDLAARVTSHGRLTA